jgi:hypothetical protein
MSKVYAVIGGFDYEGENFKSLRLFDCFSAAVAYQKHLEENEGFDYAILDTREVCLESAIAAWFFSFFSTHFSQQNDSQQRTSFW